MTDAPPKPAQPISTLKTAWLNVERLFDRVRSTLVPVTYQPTAQFSTVDYAVAGAFAVVAIAIAVAGPAAFDPRVFVNGLGSFFSSDPERVIASMFEHWSHHHHRTFAHPIFSIVTFPPARSLEKLGLSQIAAATTLLAICAAASASMFYLAIRGLGIPLFGAAVSTGVLMATAGFLHWFSFIETFSYSSLTVIFMLLVLTTWPGKQLWIWSFASAGTLSMLTSNWVFGIVSAFFRLEWARFLKVTILAFAMVASAAVLQLWLFPHSKLFFSPSLLAREVRYELQFNMEADGFQRWTPRENLVSALITGAVARPPQVEQGMGRYGAFAWVNNTYTPLSEVSIAGKVAMLCWIFFVGAGLWAAWKDVARRAVTLPLLVFIVAQLCLYTVYGEIPFLYSANLLPIMVAVAAYSFLTPLRYYAFGAAALFIVLAGPYNYAQFKAAAKVANDVAAAHAAKPQ
jgi:hypothetical protein